MRKLSRSVYLTYYLTYYTSIFSDPETTIWVAVHNVFLHKQEPEIEQTDSKPLEHGQPTVSDPDSTPEKDPSPGTPETVSKRGSWPENEAIRSSPRNAKMLFKTRTLSALPLSNTKQISAFENRLLASFKARSLDENYMKNNFDNDEETALYFKLLFFGCFCMLVWKHIWLLPVMVFFLAIHVLKWVLDFFGVWLLCENLYNNVIGKVKGWWKDR